MISELRQRFNRRWTPEQYGEFLRLVAAETGAAPGFRCSETPVFLPSPLLEKVVRYGRELYGQLEGNRAYKDASDSAIPERFRVPNEAEHPLFVQADFGLVREPDGRFEPKLVEIQGFPSIYGLQLALANAYAEAYRLREIEPNLTPFLDGLDERSYIERLRRAILNGHAPEDVVLLEIDPYEQKTLPDFLMTQKLLGIEIASISDVRKQGRKLYFRGKEIKRIFNRVIVDELLRKNGETDFEFSDDLDVEWAGHPNWFFRLSKFSLPWFHHVSVPETHFLSELDELPQGLEEWVLKPLYSFAGTGVRIGPRKEEIDAIPPEERSEFVLQRKMNFVPTVETPSGATKVEIRVMYVWQDGGLQAMTTVIRTGRGKMMGVDFNKNLDWVGASAGFSLGYQP